MKKSVGTITGVMLLLAASGIVLPARADILVTGARITKLLTTRMANDPSFIVFTQGGTGPCSAAYMYFYPSGASDPEIQKRAYAAAMLALATGLEVTIEATDSSCAGAYVITVTSN